MASLRNNGNYQTRVLPFVEVASKARFAVVREMCDLPSPSPSWPGEVPEWLSGSESNATGNITVSSPFLSFHRHQKNCKRSGLCAGVCFLHTSESNLDAYVLLRAPSGLVDLCSCHHAFYLNSAEMLFLAWMLNIVCARRGAMLSSVSLSLAARCGVDGIVLRMTHSSNLELAIRLLPGPLSRP